MPELNESYSERVRREHEERLRLQVGNTINYDADRATKIWDLQAQTGLPEAVIDADFDNISEQARLRQFDPDKYKDTAPAWRKFAAENPMDLAVLKRDEEALTKFERAYRELDSTTGWERFKSHSRDLLRTTAPIQNAVKSSYASNERMLIGARQARGDIRPGDEERLAELRKYEAAHDFGANKSKYIVWLAKQSANMLGSIEARVERGLQYGYTGAAIGGSFGSAGGTFVLPGGGTAVGGAGGAVGGFGIGFTAGSLSGGYEYGAELNRGEAYLEFKEMGFSHEDASWASEVSGTFGGVVEALGGQIMFSKLPGVRNLTGEGSRQVVKQLLGKEGAQQILKRAAYDYGAGVSGEVVTEILQESSMIAMGEVLKIQNPGVAEQITAEEFQDRIANIALETLKSTFLIAGAGPGQRIVMDTRRANKAKTMELVFKSMKEGAEAAEIRKNLPKKWKSFVDRVTAEGTVENVGMDVKRFEEFFQGNDVDPAEAANELGVTNYDEAKFTGGDVEIPIESFASQIATNEKTFDAMLPDIRAHEGDMTIREAQEFETRRDEIMSILEQGSDKIRETEQNDDIEAIVSSVQSQLVASGYDAATAGQLGTIMRGIGVMAQREGMDAKPLFERVFSGVRAATDNQETAGQDVDVRIDPMLNALRDKNYPDQESLFGQSLMNFISEAGGIDVGDPELAAMDFELGAQDLGFSAAKVNRWKKGGRSVSDIAEAAAEAGYIPAAEENVLIEALRSEIGGSPVYGTVDRGDAGLRDYSRALDELQGLVNEAAIDLDTMTNAEVRAILAGRQTLAQIDTSELQWLTALVEQQTGISQSQAEDIDTSLAVLNASIPLVSDQQDFGNLTFTDRVKVLETGKRAIEKVSAQREFDRATKRKNLMKTLLDCVSG